MNRHNFPEDSMLKRHFDSTVEMKRQRWLQLPPTDSILYRHASSKRTKPSRAQTSAKRTASTSNTSTRLHAGQQQPESQGFFAKFFSFFNR
jgi:hypothetical protein